MAFWASRYREEAPKTIQPVASQPSSMGGDEPMVDALEGGEIVRVSEKYARRESLPILRKYQQPAVQKPANKLGPKETGGMDTFRRPLRSDKDGVRAALSDNFHWALSQKRRQLGLSRKQLAVAVNAREQDVKLLENGVLPSNDFVLISALERQLGVNLRREPTASAPPVAALRPARSVLAGGSVPLFEKPEMVPSRASVRPKEIDGDALLNQEDLLGDIEIDDKKA